MNIYEKLGFTEGEVAYILDFIRNDTADIYAEARKDRDTIQSYRKSVDEAIKHLELIINTQLPRFYEPLTEIEVEVLELVYKNPYGGAEYTLRTPESESLNQKLSTALEALKRIPEINYLHKGKNFPTKGKDRLTRTYYFLKKRYETKTGKKAGRTNDPDTGTRTGDFLDFVRQVSSDIDERWVRSLVSHSSEHLAKANKNNN